MELQQLLRDTGLTQYEASAYYSLIAQGILSANEISRHANIPMGKIYETLKSLCDKGFIEVQQSRPKKYHPIKPKAAFGQYYNRVCEEKQRELSVLKDTISLIEESMPEKRKVTDDEEMFWTTIFDTKEMEAAYVSYFMAAEREICIVTSRAMRESTQNYYQKLLSSSVMLIVETAKKGTMIRCLDSHTGIKEILGTILEKIDDNKTKEKISNNIKIIEKDSDYDFVLIDEDTTVIDIGDPITPGTVLGTFKICDTKFNARLKKEFERLWKTSLID